MDLPVVFAMDRAGIVGEDGETHQGVFDISFLRAIPNMTLCAPRDEKSMHQAVAFAAAFDRPLGLRYPRGAFLAAGLPESTPVITSYSIHYTKLYDSETFLAQLDAMGYVRDYSAPQTLLLSVRADYGADDFAQMITFLMNGARLVGMHDTTLYATQEQRFPGVGALLRMLSYAAAVPFTVVGKPSEAFYGEALRLLRTQCSDAAYEGVTMISDDYAGDLTGASYNFV